VMLTRSGGKETRVVPKKIEAKGLGPRWGPVKTCIFDFYLRAAISDCLLIGFIRATETLRKN
jgi:hypothetical protein